MERRELIYSEDYHNKISDTLINDKKIINLV